MTTRGEGGEERPATREDGAGVRRCAACSAVSPMAPEPAPAPAAEDLDTLRLQVLADDPECYRALYDLAPTTPAAIRAILDAWRAQDAEEAADVR